MKFGTLHRRKITDIFLSASTSTTVSTHEGVIPAAIATLLFFYFSRPLGYSVPTHHGSDEIETCGERDEEEVVHNTVEKVLGRNVLLSPRLSSQRNTLNRGIFLWYR